MRRRMLRRAAVAAGAATLLALGGQARGAGGGSDFPIAPAASSGIMGDVVGLDFRGGVLRASWGDDSAALSGNPDPATTEVAFAAAQVAADGSVTVGAPVDVSRAPGPQAGGSLAVGPAGIFLAADQAGCCDMTSLHAVSSDGGATWTGASDLPGALNGGGPQVAVDGYGNVFLALVDQSVFDHPFLRVYVSTDGAASFTELPLPARADLDAWPSIAVGGGGVFVGFSRYDGTARASVASAPVTGLGAVGPFAIQTAPGSESISRPDVAAGRDGRVMLVYETRPPDGFSVLAAQVDPDGLGPAGFGEAVPVANIGAYASEAEPQAVFGPSGRAYVVYRDQELRPDTQDVLLRLSDDGGLTWSAAQPVNASVASPERRFPAVAVEPSTGRLAAAWYDERDGGGRLYGRVMTGVQPPAWPTSPLNLTATAASRSSIELTWTDRSADETGFEITRSDGATLTAPANATSFEDTGLPENTTYGYVVRAVNDAGRSTATNVAEATTVATPPDTPSGLTAIGGRYNGIDLAWNAAARADYYEIELSTDGTNFTYVHPSTDTEDRVYPLESGVTYYFRVRAVNSGGASGYSNVASSTIELAPPAAPSGLTATAVASYRIDLAWQDNSSNEDDFEIEESRNGKSYKRVATATATATSYSRYGLRRGTTYHYRIRACNAAGCSAYAGPVSATTPR